MKYPGKAGKNQNVWMGKDKGRENVMLIVHVIVLENTFKVVVCNYFFIFSENFQLNVDYIYVAWASWQSWDELGDRYRECSKFGLDNLHATQPCFIDKQSVKCDYKTMMLAEFTLIQNSFQ